jgi:hypothetical protein
LLVTTALQPEAKLAPKIAATNNMPQGGKTSMRIQVVAAAMLVGATLAEGHSWYSHECCHDTDCHPVPCEEIKKITGGRQ